MTWSELPPTPYSGEEHRNTFQERKKRGSQGSCSLGVFSQALRVLLTWLHSRTTLQHSTIGDNFDHLSSVALKSLLTSHSVQQLCFLPSLLLLYTWRSHQPPSFLSQGRMKSHPLFREHSSLHNVANGDPCTIWMHMCTYPLWILDKTFKNQMRDPRLLSHFMRHSPPGL